MYRNQKKIVEISILSRREILFKIPQWQDLSNLLVDFETFGSPQVLSGNFCLNQSQLSYLDSRVLKSIFSVARVLVNGLR